MKKLAIILNIVFAILIITGDVLYTCGIGGLAMKSVTSALFLLMGISNLLIALKEKVINLKFSIFLVIGLLFAMLGDIVLNVHFIAGAVLFAVGHIFFFVSYCFISKINWRDLAYGACIFVPAVLFITLAPIFDFGGILMEIVCVVYAIIISLMVGKALSNLISTKNLLSVIIFVGSILFFISDLMLLLNVFAGLPKIIDILCLATYYPAEILLAFSPISNYMFAKKTN